MIENLSNILINLTANIAVGCFKYKLISNDWLIEWRKTDHSFYIGGVLFLTLPDASTSDYFWSGYDQ